MIKPPFGADSFPEDYLAYIQSMETDQTFPGTILFKEPKDPAMTLGRQGDENFWYSVLIGFRQDKLFVVLKFDSKTAYSPKIWQYCIVGGAEWDVAMEFPDFKEMLEYLKNEKPYQPPPLPPSKRKPKQL